MFARAHLRLGAPQEGRQVGGLLARLRAEESHGLGNKLVLVVAVTQLAVAAETPRVPEQAKTGTKKTNQTKSTHTRTEIQPYTHSHTHTHTHTHTHAIPHVRTHARTHTLTRAHTHAHAHARAHTHKHKQTHTHTHTQTHSHTHIHTCTYIHAPTHTQRSCGRSKFQAIMGRWT